MTRVCLYTRISTDEENQPTSLASQQERLTAFCSVQEDWHVVAHHEDRASGTNLDRPGLQAALDTARTGKADVLLVYRVDRLSRKVRQLSQLAEELDRHNVILKSATEPFDTGSPAGRMMLQMLGVFAEFEHATIVDRITAGIERRAKQGRWYSGRPPFGYTHDPEQHMLRPDPVTAPVVGRIFSLYVEDRLGTTAIAKQLRAELAPGPTAGWGHPAVHRILTNPTYLGRIRWRDQVIDSTHEPLINQDTFDKAQATLAQRGQDISRRRGNPSDFLLSGLIRCATCGKAYIGMSARGNGGTYHYYACTARQKYGPEACNADRLARHKLEHAVIGQLADIYRDGTLIHQALANAADQAKRDRPAAEQRRESVRAEIARGEHAIARYFDAFEQGRLSPERCDERVGQLTTRLENLRAQDADLGRQAADEPDHAPSNDDLAAVANHLDRLIAEGDPATAKQLLRLLVAELRVHSRDHIQPTYRVIDPEVVCATSGKVETVGIEPTSAGA